MNANQVPISQVQFSVSASQLMKRLWNRKTRGVLNLVMLVIALTEISYVLVDQQSRQQQIREPAASSEPSNSQVKPHKRSGSASARSRSHQAGHKKLKSAA